jgi:hypothetical protein
MGLQDKRRLDEQHPFGVEIRTGPEHPAWNRSSTEFVSSFDGFDW